MRKRVIFIVILVLGLFITIVPSVIHKINNHKQEQFDILYNRNHEAYVYHHYHSGDLFICVNIDERLIEYQHLGSDTNIKHTANWTKIESGDAILAEDQLTLTTTITEHDAIDDTSTKDTVFSIPPFSQSKTVLIKVREKGGTRYSGAYATWEITYSIEPVVDYWDVVNFNALSKDSN